ncbi:calcineurin B-like protein 4 [Beta vulgaris subsp. vulgaris]|uniref:calcineurin B-like protein 4 n=1 Tax=Beta vulgaris subsp. vulgaris TaxID=3555 RepID=UPI002036A808|nr:calcineurin B-like protein 4 [Beta vulgaris subsp. vulgaris]XP_010666446.2 calcineurin B-like protein 4 [Beta vulgaris subsp. vulgaris]
MGCQTSKDGVKLPACDNFSLLAEDTVFTFDEVELLYDLFNRLSNSVVRDGFIQKEELQLALFKNSMKRSLFLDRMFDLFDVNQNGLIEFGEFVRALGVFHPNTPETDKMKYAFQLYDLRGTGYIEHEELKEMVSALLYESDLYLSDDLVEAIVDKTFKETDSKGDGKIDMEEWEEYVTKNPKLLKNMTLPYLADINIAFPTFVVNKEAECLQRKGPEED